MRRFFTVLFTFVLRIFFRRIEIERQDRVPLEGPVMFVLNHPNALIDPGLILCLAPRPVSFLAKSTLFTMPVVKWLVIGFDSLPVYRRDDENADPSQNKKAFEQAQALLARGGSIAIFPEGTSHSDPALRRLKSGAARLALGTAATLPAEAGPFKIVPAGLYYTDKRTFRSELLICYGEPFDVPAVPLDASFEPTREDVRALTERIREALDDLTLQAEHVEALHLVERASRVFTAASGESEQDLTEGFTLRRQILEHYHALKARLPERLEALRGQLEGYEDRLGALGLSAEHVSPERFTLAAVFSYALRSLLFMVFLGPLALVGVLTHYPAYRLVGYLSIRLAKGEDDTISTFKLLGAMLFFGVTWLIVGGVLFALLPWTLALPISLGVPICGYAALVWQEKFERTFGAARGLWVFLTRRREYEALHAERQSIRAAMLAVQEEVRGLEQESSEAG